MILKFNKYGNLIESNTDDELVQYSVGANTLYVQFDGINLREYVPYIAFERSDGQLSPNVGMAYSGNSIIYNFSEAWVTAKDGILKCVITLNQNNIVKKTATFNLSVVKSITGNPITYIDEVAYNEMNSRMYNLEVKLNGFTDLGVIEESPENAENTILNAINTAGVYTFTYNGDTYLMLVNTKDNNLKQIVIGIETQDIDIKYWIRHPYYDTFMVTPFETTNKDYVEDEFIKVRNFINDKFSNLMGGENINEMYDTIKEIAEALENNEDVVEAINNALVNKANKSDIPTKLSQLEADVELSVSEEQVMEIIEANSEQVGKYNIGTSASYDVDSDNEIPTSKAVASMIGALGGGSSFKLVEVVPYTETYPLKSSNGIIPVSTPWKENTLYMIEAFGRTPSYEDEKDWYGDYDVSTIKFVKTDKTFTNPYDVIQLNYAITFGGAIHFDISIDSPLIDEVNGIQITFYEYDEDTGEEYYIYEKFTQLSFKIYEVCELGGNE